MVRRSSISCSRSGDLSIDRLSSRMVHGAGLRSATFPSLSMSANWNPRGRSFCRTSDAALGSVSVINRTSRSTRSPGRSARSSSWWRKFGSLGVSAKMITGRATQIKSFKFISDASNIVVRSASQRAMTVSSAITGTDVNVRKINGMVWIAALIIPMNIGLHLGKSKTPMSTILNNFNIKPSVRSGRS